MRLTQQLLTANECYQLGRPLTVQGVMIHSTGANNPNVSRYVPGSEVLGRNTAGSHWDRFRPDGRQVCVHAFVGKFADGEVGTVQTLPWEMRGWHAGNSRGNGRYIGFEICEDALEDGDYFSAVYRESVELTAMLCRRFDLDPLKEGTVLCHAEGHRIGVASNHADVLHWFPRHGKSMDSFRADVA